MKRPFKSVIDFYVIDATVYSEPYFSVDTPKWPTNPMIADPRHEGRTSTYSAECGLESLTNVIWMIHRDEQTRSAPVNSV